MLKIRLRRVGKKNQPSYRVVVVEHTAPVQGSYLELLGSYNPRATTFMVKEDRVLHWLNHGAQPSERMAKLLTHAGLTHKQISLPDYDRKPKRPPKKAPVEATPKPALKTESTLTESAGLPTSNEPAETVSEAVAETASNVASDAEQTTSEESGSDETAEAEGGSNLEADEEVPSEDQQ